MPHRMQRSGPLSIPAQLQHALHPYPVLRRPGGYGEVIDTRSHPELGRENPLRRWYCVLRRGRVGRRQVFTEQIKHNPNKTHSSTYP